MHPFPLMSKALVMCAYVITLAATGVGIAADVLVHRHSTRGAR